MFKEFLKREIWHAAEERQCEVINMTEPKLGVHSCVVERSLSLAARRSDASHDRYELQGRQSSEAF